MRALMTAGPALDRDNMAGYNCAYAAVDHPRVFDEALYILSCGTGMGFSVERQFISQLPDIAEEFHNTDTTIVVEDSKIGWAGALREVISLLYSGKIPKIDVSKVRPAGSRLKVFGGRASGPQPLLDLFEYAIRTFQGAAGRKLNSIECHGLMCKIGEAIVVGGVRRSALISLSNLTDQRMRNAKSGQWWEQHPEYSLANNSVAYTEKPDTDAFITEWLALYQSKSGERGIFNRAGAKRKMKRLARRDPDHEWGGNPCFAYDTPLLTSEGYFPIGSLVDQEISIWNGDAWSKVTPFCTGINELLRVSFTDGTSVDCTPYHNFLVIEEFKNDQARRVKAEDLHVGM
jgi:ribonucleoside-diphosphate reductase alpha chain